MMLSPNKTSGKNVQITFSALMLAAFILFQSNIHVTAQSRKGEKKIFTMVDQTAEFPGGMSEMRTYLAKSIHYPDSAKKNNIQGKVVLQFIVNKDGSISDVDIMHNLAGGCGAEARRVVLAMPKWKPGMMNGQAVDMYYTLPIYFKTR
ncbi:energy transducer TonB [Taibaiella lutea]|uniref:Energy transducer TonB n=1 Tax=Taibaiella lutea TaxID=2608001 RepID=A0A5M6CI93_9BACT|nr:energy transducer TonB [Taibaiella lutea]KAA5533672.1 energy transducer TonB [Taibaiella lutea]